ncbi:MAG: trimeric intracellular cation channel family protein [Ruminococcaceae bacterium]|nr:trimeric intracellular cation channel family protein [Oscillospiraceae bacterium]
MSGTVLLIFEIIGTISFAISGAVTALQKKMDIFGVVILGLTTAVGGGVIRDLVLGQTPPATFQNPLYALVAVATAVVVFFPAVRRLFDRHHRSYEMVLLVMDSLGLGVFTVVGIRTAYGVSHGFSLFLLIFVGVVTGIGGGVMRDVLAGNTPYIFVKHFYATASLIGAVLCVTCWPLLGEMWAMVCGAAVVVLLRLLAARYHWSLPKAE